LLVLPLIFDPHGNDVFRYPKELALRVTVLLSLGIFATALSIGRLHMARAGLPRSVTLVCILIVVWGVTTTLLSTNRPLSARALEYTLEALLFFLAAWMALSDVTLNQCIAAPLISGLFNAVIGTLQAFNIWNPFPLQADLSPHLRTTAFLGNPNDVGAYLMPLTLVTAAIALMRRRWLWIGMAIVMATGLAASQALTAIIATSAAIAVLMFIALRRVIPLYGAAAALLICCVAFPPIRERLTRFSEAAQRHDLGGATSYRIYPLAAAWDMFRDHPVSGAGPGTFKFHFLEYMLRRTLADPGHFPWMAQNFGEAHSDHAQILAEEGLPGWLLLMVSLIVISRSTVSPPANGTDERAQFARLLAAPLSVGLFTVMIAAFPLELPAVLHLDLYVIAAVLRWSQH